MRTEEGDDGGEDSGELHLGLVESKRQACWNKAQIENSEESEYVASCWSILHFPPGIYTQISNSIGYGEVQRPTPKRHIETSIN